MISTILASAIIGTQTPPPSVDYADLLTIVPFTRNPIPALQRRTISIAFAPPGDLKVRAIIESQGKTIGEIPVNEIFRVATFARVTFKGSTFIPIGEHEGTRTLTIFVNDQIAGRMDYAMTKKSGGDPYAPKVEWTTTGAWQTHACFEYPINTTNQQRVMLTYWMSSQEIGPEKSYKLDIVLRRGSTVIAKSPRSREINFPELVRKQEPIHLPNGQPLMAPDLAKMSGPFVLELKVGSRIIRSYRGEISGGKFTSHKRSALTHSDPLTFLPERFLSDGSLSVIDVLRTWITTN